jgi:hypothetical protein
MASFHSFPAKAFATAGQIKRSDGRPQSELATSSRTGSSDSHQERGAISLSRHVNQHARHLGATGLSEDVSPQRHAELVCALHAFGSSIHRATQTEVLG